MCVCVCVFFLRVCVCMYECIRVYVYIFRPNYSNILMYIHMYIYIHPQVRTMTFVCDLFSPHEGQISLQILADTCNIVTSGYGIVGLSCQLSSADGMRVVKRGQVKDARRHFAYDPLPYMCMYVHT
jgi:hypothetical protein